MTTEYEEQRQAGKKKFYAEMRRTIIGILSIAVVVLIALSLSKHHPHISQSPTLIYDKGNGHTKRQRTNYSSPALSLSVKFLERRMNLVYIQIPETASTVTNGLVRRLALRHNISGAQSFRYNFSSGMDGSTHLFPSVPLPTHLLSSFEPTAKGSRERFYAQIRTRSLASSGLPRKEREKTEYDSTHLLKHRRLQQGSSPGKGKMSNDSTQQQQQQHQQQTLLTGEPGVWAEHIEYSQFRQLNPRLHNPAFLFTFVREPAERYISGYYDFAVEKKGGQVGDAQLVRYINHTSNFMVQFLKEKPPPPGVSFPDRREGVVTAREADVDRIIAGFDFIGCTEYYDESLVLLSEKMGVPLTDMIYLNTSATRNSTALAISVSGNNNKKNSNNNSTVNEEGGGGGEGDVKLEFGVEDGEAMVGLHALYNIHPDRVKKHIDGEFRSRNAMDYLLFEKVSLSIQRAMQGDNVRDLPYAQRVRYREEFREKLAKLRGWNAAAAELCAQETEMGYTSDYSELAFPCLERLIMLIVEEEKGNEIELESGEDGKAERLEGSADLPAEEVITEDTESTDKTTALGGTPKSGGKSTTGPAAGPSSSGSGSAGVRRQRGR